MKINYIDINVLHYQFRILQYLRVRWFQSSDPSPALMINCVIFICRLMLLWINNLDYFCILQLKHLSAMLPGIDASAMCFYDAVMVHRDLYRCQDGPPQGVWMFLRSRNKRSCNKQHGPQITTEVCLIWYRLFTLCTVKLVKINVVQLKKGLHRKFKKTKIQNGW